MAAIEKCPDNVFEIQSRALKHLFTRIRDENTNCKVGPLFEPGVASPLLRGVI